MQYNILPAPKIIEETQGTFNLVNAGIYLQNGLDARVVAKAEALRTRLWEKTGQKHFLSPGQEAKNSILICKTKNIKAEEYILEIDANGVKIEGGSDAGCFYGILTFLQILEADTNELSGVVIKDWPDMAYRGFYFDATRGRVPSVEGAKKLINRLASLKINALQFYVEHTFDFKEFSSDNRTSNDYLTAKDIFDAAKAGDAVAAELVEELGEVLGRALSHVAAVTDPEAFVIGGGVSRAGEILTKTVERHYNHGIMKALQGKEFRLATLGNDAGIFGCAKMILDCIEK